MELISSQPGADAPEQAQLAPFEASPEEAAMVRASAWGCAMAFEFPIGTQVHRGVLHNIRRQFRGRRPGAYREDNVVHASLGLPDGSERSRAFAQQAAEHLLDVLPNARLIELDVIEMPKAPLRPGSRG